jgi:hypothetical protein
MTRLEFAKMMFSLYSLVLPEGFELIPMSGIMPEFSDMSNAPNDMDYYYALFMVSLGLMEARNAETITIPEFPDYTLVFGEFDPHGSLTEREAMQIMYKTIELSRNQTVTTYEDMDEALFIPDLAEWGLLDEPGGPNAYTAGERLSKRLALVRIARFIKYEEDMTDKDYGVGAGFFDNYYVEDGGG